MVEIVKLSNGIKCILDRRNYNQTVTVKVFFDVGSRDEPKDYYGLTHFIEHMFFKGTAKRPETKEISAEVDQYGGYINATTDYDITTYFIKINKKRFEICVELLADMLFHSLFRTNDIKAESEVVVQELKLLKSEPDKFIYEMSGSQVYKGTNMEHSVGGSIACVRQGNREKFMKYLNNYYRPNNTIISIAGNIPKTDQATLILEKHFNRGFEYKPSKQLKFKKREIYPNFRDMQNEMRFITKSFPKVSNAYIILAFPGWKYFTKEYFVMEVISSILGANMSSRLFITIREKNALTYSIKTFIEAYKDVGTFGIYYSTDTDFEKIRKSIELVCEELEKIKTYPVSLAELHKAKEYIIGTDIMDGERAEYIANLNGIQYMYLGKIVDMKQFHNYINEVTPEDIIDVSNRLFDLNKLNLSIINDKQIKLNDLDIDF